MNVPRHSLYLARLFLLLALGALMAAGCSTSAEPQGPPAERQVAEGDTLADEMPLTAANLRGHKALYDEGWFIVTSTRDALRYASEHGVETSGAALAQVLADLAGRTDDTSERFAAGLRASRDHGAAVHHTGQRFAQVVTRAAERASDAQFEYGLKHLSHSWRFVTGGVYLGRHTDTHWERLKGTWPQYYADLRQDFSNVHALNRRIADTFRTDITVGWDAAFDTAVDEFQQEYELSAARPNSLVALGDILAGYLKAAYEGLVKPSGRALVVGAAAGAQGVSYVFTPVADSAMLAGRTVQATGLSVYHGGRTAIEVVSPSVEAGFLTALGIASLGTGAATRLGGETLGLANQVAFTGAGVAVGAAQGTARTLAESGRYVALAAYDVGKGTMSVTINLAQSGVVLGYNALTAIPAQLLVAVPSAVVLAYEGPRLVLLRIRQAAASDGTSKAGEAVPASRLENLPVGAVVDLEALRAEPGVEVEVLTDDPEVTRRVLESVRKDLSAGSAP